MQKILGFKKKKTPFDVGRVNIPRTEYDALKAFARKNGVTIASSLSVAIVEMLQNHGGRRVRP